MTDFPALCDAIKRYRLVRLWYDGGERIVEPHVYGVGGGRELLRAYQVSGHSHGADQGWKVFRLAEAKDVVVLEEGFAEPRQGHMRNDPTMTKIYCAL